MGCSGCGAGRRYSWFALLLSRRETLLLALSRNERHVIRSMERSASLDCV